MQNYIPILLIIIFIVALVAVLRFLVRLDPRAEEKRLKQEYVDAKPWSIEHKDYLEKIKIEREKNDNTKLPLSPKWKILMVIWVIIYGVHDLYGDRIIEFFNK